MKDRAARLGPKFDEAVQYAIDTHRFQRKKGTGVPYVAHLFGVCAIVLERGGDETQAIGGLLHDAAEDQGGEEQLRKIRERFGAGVQRIVRECSDALAGPGDAKPPWLERKQAYVARLGSLDPDDPALLVSAADKLYNLSSIAQEVLISPDGKLDENVYERFRGRKWGTLWYYRAIVAALKGKGGERVAQIVVELERLLDKLDKDSLESNELLRRFVQECGAEEAGAGLRTGGG